MSERFQISDFNVGDCFRCFGPGEFEGEVFTVEAITDCLECRSSLPRFSQTPISFYQRFFDAFVGRIEVLPKEVFDRAEYIAENGVEGTVAADWTDENKVAA